MFKKILYFFVASFLILSLFACSEAFYSQTAETNSALSSIVQLADETTPERKIMYEVDISFDVEDLEESSDFLKAAMDSDEWFDQELITTSLHSYVIRIRTDHLDAFIQTLQDEFMLRSYKKIGTDISIMYQDTSNQILSLEAQLERLVELYDQSTLSEMIIINEQISDIEVELATLQGIVNQYDSLVDYSTVTLKFYGSTIVTKSPFFNRLGNAFVDGFDALLLFFDGLFIVLATIFPFLIVIAIGVFTGFYIYKRKKNKKKAIDQPKIDK
ncbi:MAG: DUF4349 domain-containing protein [Firmicutes bacterium]|nr:DUF4349 domain-containing protein [Bacillota bacterium]